MFLTELYPKTLKFLVMSRRFHGALGCPDFESEENVFDDPLMNTTSTNTTEPSAIENGE